MSWNPPSKKSSNHQHKSIRLKDYDYSQPGAYFVTSSVFLSYKHKTIMTIQIAGHRECLEGMWRSMLRLRSAACGLLLSNDAFTLLVTLN